MKNLENRKISNKISPFVAFDLFICSEITGPDFPFKFLKTRKLETYHGNGISGFHKKIEVIRKFDAHFAIGPKFNEFLDSIYTDGEKPNIYNVGYPKLDILLKKSALSEELRKLYKLRDKPTVLYAPHWNPYGSLHIFGTKIIEELVKYDINLLIKPHHYLYAKYPEDNWKNRFDDFAGKYEHVTLVTRPNTQELYPIADLMISDTGTSAPFEFCILQKPLLVFANYALFNENPNEDNSEEKAILEASICFDNLQNFTQMMEAFLNKNETFIKEIESQKKRQKALIDSLLYNPGNASSYAEKAILKEINL
jgi:CDP-glycerol glycerophosphotransferase (TagB/SpsB family)